MRWPTAWPAWPALAALCACGPARADLVVVNGGDAALLDPQLGNGMAETRLGAALQAGLTRLDPRSLAPLPDLAEDWTRSADDRVWNFRLRRDLRWSDGNPLGLADFLASWERLRGADSLSPQRDWLRGARLAAATDAEGRETLRVEFDGARPAFAEMAALPPLAPLHPALRAAPPGALPRPYVSSGPYRLVSRAVRDRVRVERNPHYWDAERVACATVDFLAVESQFTALNLFLTGEADYVPSVPPLAVPRLLREHGAAFRPSPQFASLFLRLNLRHPLLAEADLRRALAMGIDRAALAAALGGLRPPSARLVPAILAGWAPPPAPLDFDPATARALLAGLRERLRAQGREPERALAELELLAPASELNRDLAAALREQWLQHLGLAVRIRLLEGREARAAERAGDYLVSRSSWVGDYLDPATFLDLFRSGAADNRTGFSDPEYDRLLDAAAQAPAPGARLALLAEAEALLLAAAPVIPLLADANQELVAPQLAGFHPNPRGHVDWSALRPRP